jgi:hypothetical protein
MPQNEAGPLRLLHCSYLMRDWYKWARWHDATPELKTLWRATHCTTAKGEEKAELHPTTLHYRGSGGEFELRVWSLSVNGLPASA